MKFAANILYGLDLTVLQRGRRPSLDLGAVGDSFRIAQRQLRCRGLDSAGELRAEQWLCQQAQQRKLFIDLTIESHYELS